VSGACEGIPADYKNYLPGFAYFTHLPYFRKILTLGYLPDIFAACV
jgi:hypothetical protein